MKSTNDVKKKPNTQTEQVVGWWMFSTTWKLYWNNAKPESMPGTGLGLPV